MTTRAPAASTIAWFRPAEADPDAALRLFLLPCAGAGATMYHPWHALLPARFAAQSVQLPGRQDRWREPAHTALGPLLVDLEEQLLTEMDERPYAFFGHSMGALLSYRLAIRLGRLGQPPALLAVSGWAPEGFAGPTGRDLTLDDAGLTERMRELGALPGPGQTGAEVATPENPDFVRLVLPAMRADVSVCAGYLDDGAPAPCPIVAYAGAEDPLMAARAMESWRGRSPRFLGTRVYPGGHFFLEQAALAIVADLTAEFLRLPSA